LLWGKWTNASTRGTEPLKKKQRREKELFFTDSGGPENPYSKEREFSG